MACVYRVHHQILESAHAVKVLHAHLARRDDIRQRFLSEARIQARLRHPHMLPVTDIINEPGVAGLVMEYLEGEDLGVWLEREERLPLETAIAWMQQALSALDFVHKHSIVHRDLKPSNLFLSRTATGQTVVRVMDFGIAKVHEKNRQLTNPDMGKMGTLRYMSPEQLRRPDLVDHRTDIFAMGAILYEALVGRSPFDDDSDYHVMRRITEGQYTDPGHGIPAALVDVIRRALATEPAQRFDSAAAMSAALNEVVQADRQRRAATLLHAANHHGLDHEWWLGGALDANWLAQQEQRLQAWRQDNGHTDVPVAEPAASPVEQRWLPGKVLLEMAHVPAGSFVMGSPPTEQGRHADEGPQRTVTLSPFWIMTTPVTQRQWMAVTEENPALFDGDERNPVERITWLDAVRFANQLSALFGLSAAYFMEEETVRWDRTADGFRLPTEAEWEHACRAGGDAAFWWGEAPSTEHAWHAANAHGQTQPVGQLPANDWGLKDTGGNVYEWCWDRLGGYNADDTNNPVGAAVGTVRVLRGGSFRSEATDLRAAFRNAREPDFCHQSVGVRLVRGPPVPAAPE